MISCKRPAHPYDHLQKVGPGVRGVRGSYQGDRGDRTEGGEEGKGDGGERGGEEILAHGWAGQQKVVQEVLAD